MLGSTRSMIIRKRVVRTHGVELKDTTDSSEFLVGQLWQSFFSVRLRKLMRQWMGSVNSFLPRFRWPAPSHPMGQPLSECN